ncbi:hypothetical protein MVEN_00678300 [Mycena venus]|uniref:Uncharacterized protein n=1 Tax=Mycena venus TaxID=2733690 RepID=A0A8H7D8D7_9AGAR|nr:hypothetical protein MVEN_00678300 [Mycena venus]
MAGGILHLFALTAVVARLATASPTPALVTILAPFQGDPATGSASVAGVDAQGHTTYIFTDSDSTGPETATVVAGSDYFSFGAAISSADAKLDCGLQGTTGGVCTVFAAPSVSGVVTLSATDLGTVVLDVPTPTNKPNSAGRQGFSVPAALAMIGLPLAYQLL